MKIVVLDGCTLNPGDLSWKDFEKFGEITVYDRTPESRKRLTDIAIASLKAFLEGKPINVVN